jgi:hypothetical protein
MRSPREALVFEQQADSLYRDVALHAQCLLPVG